MTKAVQDGAVTRWNQLHAVPRFSPRYPSELVIRWTFRNFPRDRAREFSLLDVGAGGGRHAIFWAREGYFASASDVSSVAVSHVTQWAARENLAVAAQVADADSLPFADASFDGVLAFGVLYYLPYERMQRAISEIWRVLKPDGRAFVMTKSAVDSRCCRAQQVAPWSYRVAKAENGAGWEAEVGLVLTLLDRDALRECVGMFAGIAIDRSSVTSCNGRFVDDEWLVELRK